jgi:polyhydroxyalkanoate synthase
MNGAASAMTETACVGAKLLAGAELFARMQDTDVQIVTTPKGLIWQQDKVKLYRFRPLAAQRICVAMLLA